MARICPRCSAARRGAGRYCASCEFDFWHDAAGRPQIERGRGRVGSRVTTGAQASASKITVLVIAGILLVLGSSASNTFLTSGVAVPVAGRAATTASEVARPQIPREQAVEFAMRERHSNEVLRSLLEQLESATLTGDLNDVSRVAKELEGVSSIETHWLGAQATLPCHVESKRALLGMLMAMSAAAAVFEDYANTGSPGTFERGNALATTAGRKLRDATSVMTAVNAKCAR